MSPTLVKRVGVYSDGSYKLEIPASSRPPLWRVKHWVEAGREENTSRPEVWPLFPNHFTEFGYAWQKRSREMNPRLSDSKWTSFYDTKTILTNNGNGFGANPPRVNYITGENIGAANPKCELLTCGGNVLTGVVDGNNLRVDVLNGLSTPPALEWILARPWYYVVAVNWYVGGSVGRFPQGEQPSGEVVPILHPLIGDPTHYPNITIPLSCLEKWDADFIPDVFKVY